MEACEVAVLGGGPAGSATAIALARLGVAGVCLVAPERVSAAAVGETLLPDTGPLLDRLGLWERFLGEGHEPCLGSCSAWGSEAVGFNDFLLNVRGSGWHLDRARFDAFLLAAAADAGVSVRHGARFVGAEPCGQGFHLRLARPQRTLRARFVVDATGTRAAFARSQGARRVRHDALMFVYGFFAASESASALRLTMVEATESGWWYTAGLPEGRVAVAFASDPGFVRSAGLAQRERWLPVLLATRHVARRLDGCRLRPGLVARVAPSGRSDVVAGERWLAVGDAAAAYDPLAAEGIHKALANGLEAAEAASRSLESDFEPARAYGAQVAARFEAYCEERAALYAAEPRWAEAPFWRRRRSVRADHERRDVVVGAKGLSL